MPYSFNWYKFLNPKGYEKVMQEVHDAEVRAKAIDEFLHLAEVKITDAILQRQSQLNFASGLCYANRLLDEVAEQLKAGGKHE